MQVAAQPAALLLAGGDQLLAARLQLGGERAGPGGRGGLPDDVGEQPLVPGDQLGADAVPGEQQPADLLAAVGDRQRLDRGRPPAVLGDQLLRRPTESTSTPT